MSTLLQAPYNQFLDDDGNPLTGGFVYSYAAGTDTPKDTYTDYTGVTPASNPVELDAAGRADIWLTGSYKFTVTDSNDVVIRTVDHVTAVDQGGDMTKAVYDPANIQQQLVGTTAVQTVTNKTLSLTAGTTGVAPLTMTAGTNMTTPTSGSWEYSSRTATFTPNGNQRGVVPARQTIILNADLATANVNTAQSIFGKSVTLSSNTYYEFTGDFFFSKSAGATSHTFSILYGGTATLNGISAQMSGASSTTSFTAGLGTPFFTAPQAATAVGVTGAVASANSFVIVRVSGTVSVNASGTFIPQFILSAAPGGAYSTVARSKFSIWPVAAAGADVNVGTWT